MQISDDERRYLACLEVKMTFEEMAVELSMTVQEVEDFGTRFFDRAFAERKKVIQ